MSNTLKFGNGEWYGKKDTILAYNDENSNYKPLPFDFSRGSTPTGSKATTINKDGLIEEVGNNIPRIDYKDNSEGALLLEPSRTNLVTQSNDFSQSAWTKSNTTITSNSIISPDGTLNASKLYRSSTGAYLQQNVSLIGEYSYSLFAKYGDLSFVRLLLRDSSNKNVYFNIENGTVGTASSGLSASIDNLGNGWYRCSVVAAVSFTGVRIYPTQADNSTGGSNGYVHIWGAQLEQGSYPTSYIPTSESAVTRLADSCNQTVPDGVIGQTEGTMFVDCKINAQGTYTGFSLSDGTTNNEVIVRFTTTDRIEYYLRSGGSQPFGGGTTAFDTDSRVKVAIAYKSGDSVFYVNGTEVASSTNTTIPLNLSKVKFSRGNSTADFSGITKNFKVYNTRLSNSELQTLTT